MSRYRVCVDYIVEAQNENDAAKEIEPLLDAGVVSTALPSLKDSFIVEVYEDDEEFSTASQIDRLENRIEDVANELVHTWRDRQGT